MEGAVVVVIVVVVVVEVIADEAVFVDPINKILESRYEEKVT